MTLGGWLFLVGSLSLVWGLAGWCYWKLITGRSSSARIPESSDESET